MASSNKTNEDYCKLFNSFVQASPLAKDPQSLKLQGLINLVANCQKRTGWESKQRRKTCTNDKVPAYVPFPDLSTQADLEMMN